jgi:hypothetical protein
MYRLLAILACLTGLWACSDKMPADTVESLMANPERLNALRVQCKADHAKVGDAGCNAVAEATRRRFMGDGKSLDAGDPAAPPAPPVSAPKD